MEQAQVVVESASATTSTAETTTSATAATFVAATATTTPVVEGLGTTGACDQQRCSGHDGQNQCLTKHQGISLHFGTLKTPIP